MFFSSSHMGILALMWKIFGLNTDFTTVVVAAGGCLGYVWDGSS